MIAKKEEGRSQKRKKEEEEKRRKRRLKIKKSGAKYTNARISHLKRLNRHKWTKS